MRVKIWGCRRGSISTTWCGSVISFGSGKIWPLNLSIDALCVLGDNLKALCLNSSRRLCKWSWNAKLWGLNTNIHICLHTDIQHTRLCSWCWLYYRPRSIYSWLFSFGNPSRGEGERLQQSTCPSIYDLHFSGFQTGPWKKTYFLSVTTESSIHVCRPAYACVCLFTSKCTCLHILYMAQNDEHRCVAKAHD